MATVENLATLVGRNLRRIRDERGWRQEDVALRCNDAGLEWRRSTVAAVEAGSRVLVLDEVVLLALALLVGVPDLLAGDEHVRLGSGAVAPLAEVRGILQDAGSAHPMLWDTPGMEKGRAEADRTLEANEKAARKLNVSPRDLMLASLAAWGHALTIERDRRVSKLADANGNARTVQALRGHVTRQLLAELAPILADPEALRSRRVLDPPIHNPEV